MHQLHLQLKYGRIQKKKALANRDLAQYRHSSLIVLGFWLVKLANFTHSLASVLFINKFKEMTVKWFHK